MIQICAFPASLEARRDLFWSISQREVSRAFREEFSSLMKERKLCKGSHEEILLYCPGPAVLPAIEYG